MNTKETTYRGKLHHKTPGWVATGSRFHIRIRIEGPQRPLTDAMLARALLKSARFYHEKRRWWAWLFLLMPDHIHAIASFPEHESMSQVVGDWKRFQERVHGINWQDNYFDHRLRSNDEFTQKCGYIKMNPVRRDLCKRPEDWPWAVDSRNHTCAQ